MIVISITTARGPRTETRELAASDPTDVSTLVGGILDGDVPNGGDFVRDWRVCVIRIEHPQSGERVTAVMMDVDDGSWNGGLVYSHPKRGNGPMWAGDRTRVAAFVASHLGEWLS